VMSLSNDELGGTRQAAALKRAKYERGRWQKLRGLGIAEQVAEVMTKRALQNRQFEITEAVQRCEEHAALPADG